ncbi:FBXL2 isoform 11 [Pan troglodytes]|uniref:F-box and leucine rich repeat protein 2 n=3 Tax=Hominidae TaxID=9604 RepID=F8WC58_HUMAN|nr:FBXL2 isoform 11 [Pan troglodytes]PNJ74893.1 FBXL2 isoform 4 [Pongo abelii]
MVFSNNDEGLINKKLPKELLLRVEWWKISRSDAVDS